MLFLCVLLTASIQFPDRERCSISLHGPGRGWSCFYLYSLFVFLKRRLLFCETVYCVSISVFISVYKFSLMVALLLDGSTHPCSKLLFGTKVSLYSALPSANSDQFDVATVLDLMQYRLLPYIWHHCTYNSTSSDAVLVTSLTVGITVPTTALALMQYRLLPLQLASLYLQQH